MTEYRKDGSATEADSKTSLVDNVKEAGSGIVSSVTGGVSSAVGAVGNGIASSVTGGVSSAVSAVVGPWQKLFISGSIAILGMILIILGIVILIMSTKTARTVVGAVEEGAKGVAVNAARSAGRNIARKTVSQPTGGSK